jgi:hypothetical protein
MDSSDEVLPWLLLLLLDPPGGGIKDDESDFWSSIKFAWLRLSRAPEEPEEENKQPVEFAVE